LVSACFQIAELGAACLGGGKGLAYALADHMSLVLCRGASTRSVSPFAPACRQWRDRSHGCINVATNADAAGKPIERGFALLGQRHGRGQLRAVTALATVHFHEFRHLLTVAAQHIVPHCLALRLDAQSALALLRGRRPADS
jgi:hypothetical protein